jgi:hypothetical protein
LRQGLAPGQTEASLLFAAEVAAAKARYIGWAMGQAENFRRSQLGA